MNSSLKARKNWGQGLQGKGKWQGKGNGQPLVNATISLALFLNLYIYLAPPMRGRSIVITPCVCECVSVYVTAQTSTPRTGYRRLRYQKKALDARLKTNVGIALNTLGSKVMETFS